VRGKDAARQLLLSSTALVAVLTGYCRRAYGQQVCVQSGSEFRCDGSSIDTQDLTNVSNVAVTTGPNFSVNTVLPSGSLGYGITITGTGDLSYQDEYASPITAAYAALHIVNAGGYGATAGRVEVNTNGTLSGHQGIYVRNQTSGGTEITTGGPISSFYRGIAVNNLGGDLSVTTDGAVGSNGEAIWLQQLGGGAVTLNVNGDATYTGNSETPHAVYVKNVNGSSVEITTATGTSVSGGGAGIRVLNTSSAAFTSITANGDVSSANTAAIEAFNGEVFAPAGTDMNISAAAGTTLEGLGGILARHRGSGALSIDTGGSVVGRSTYGIMAQNYGTDLVISAHDVSARVGIHALQYGTGRMAITTSGDVSGNALYGILAQNYNGSELTITTEAGSTTKGQRSGIYARGNSATAELAIFAYGSVSGGAGAYYYGIDAALYYGTRLTIQTGPDSAINGPRDGIRAHNAGAGGSDITINGSLTGDRRFGLWAKNYAGDLTVTTGETSSVKSASTGISALQYGGGDLSVAVDGKIDSGYAGVFAKSIAGSSLTVTTGVLSTIRGPEMGIRARNQGRGATSVNALGNSYGDQRAGISVQGDAGSGNIQITTGSGTTRGSRGIEALHLSGGPIGVTTGGNVTGTSGEAIYARTFGDISLTVNSGSTITGANGYAVRMVYGPTTMTVAGTVKGGTGGAIQLGGTGQTQNTLTLSPTASISGTVNSIDGFGTLQFGGAGQGSFDLDDIDQVSRPGQYKGFGILRVVSGEWSLSGSSFVDFYVNGGVLKGTGSFRDLSLQGGTIAPGNSIGTIRAQNITFGSGTTYEVEVDAAGRSDQIRAAGTAMIRGGTVNVLAAGGDYAPSTRYTILTSNGLTGQFSDVTSNLAFLTPSLLYDSQNVYLVLARNQQHFSNVADTPNQTSVAGALDTFPTDHPVFLKILNLSASSARKAFDSLSGEVHASIGGALINEGRHVRDAVMGRLVQASYGGTGVGAGGPQAAVLQSSSSTATLANMMALGYSGEDLAALQPLRPRGPTVWSEGFGSWARFDGDGSAAKVNTALGGVVTGIDAEVLRDWRLGVAGGYSYSDIDADARASGGTVDAYHLLVYGGGEMGRVALRGGGAWSWQEIETSRAVFFPGFAELQTASYDGDRAQAFGEVAYRLLPASQVSAEPFAGLAYVHEETDGFAESGALAGMRSSGYREDVTYSTLGLRAATDMTLGGFAVAPRVSVAWLHAFDDIDVSQVLVFTSTGIDFEIGGTPIAKDSALIEAAVDFAVSPSATLSVAYDGQFASDADEHGIKGRASWKF